MATFERDGLRLWYAEDGSGSPIVLHTGGGGDSDMFVQGGYFDALVGAGYRVIRFDHRGHGRSDKPLCREQHRTQKYADDLVGLLDTLHLPVAAIIGYSQGMHIALAFAASYPDRASAVVGIGSVGAADDPTGWRLEAAASVREHGMAESIRVGFAESEDPPPPEWLLDNLSSTDPEIFALLLEAALDDEKPLWELLPDVAVPTLLVVGEREEDEDGIEAGVAARNARAAATVLAQGETYIVPQLRHLGVFWRSDQTLPVILRFLHDNYPPTSKTGV